MKLYTILVYNQIMHWLYEYEEGVEVLRILKQYCENKGKVVVGDVNARVNYSVVKNATGECGMSRMKDRGNIY